MIIIIDWRSYNPCRIYPRHGIWSHVHLDVPEGWYGLYAAPRAVIAGYEPRVRGALFNVVVDHAVRERIKSS